MAHLHKLGYISTSFIDDKLSIGLSELECVNNMKASLNCLEIQGLL